MADLRYIPISYLDSIFLASLMKEEAQTWLCDLGWDYSPVQQILISFMNQKLLPGYAAVQEQEAVGYTYFLMHRRKGIIGSIYVREMEFSQEITDELLSLTISGLKDTPRIKRVEAQIMPFHNLDISRVFFQNGFRHFPRRYLNLNLNAFSGQTLSTSTQRIMPWEFRDIESAAKIVAASYKNQPDAEICADYRTVSGCENYLRNVVNNPGCGVFMPETSFMALDQKDNPCGLIIGCRISDGIGMIPQIAVHPSCQGKSLGNTLMMRSLEKYKLMGFYRISLAVTPGNRRAFEWYLRLGFKLRKQFGAYLWER